MPSRHPPPHAMPTCLPVCPCRTCLPPTRERGKKPTADIILSVCAYTYIEVPTHIHTYVHASIHPSKIHSKIHQRSNLAYRNRPSERWDRAVQGPRPPVLRPPLQASKKREKKCGRERQKKTEKKEACMGWMDPLTRFLTETGLADMI